MHVVVCFVFLSPHFALATGFRFIVMPLLHECHCMFCFPLPPFEFANGFRFTAIPLLHELHCVFCIPLPFYVFAYCIRCVVLDHVHPKLEASNLTPYSTRNECAPQASC